MITGFLTEPLKQNADKTDFQALIFTVFSLSVLIRDACICVIGVLFFF